MRGAATDSGNKLVRRSARQFPRVPPNDERLAALGCSPRGRATCSSRRLIRGALVLMQGDTAGGFLPIGLGHRRVFAENRHFSEGVKVLPREALRIEDPIFVALGIPTFAFVLFYTPRSSTITPPSPPPPQPSPL